MSGTLKGALAGAAVAIAGLALAAPAGAGISCSFDAGATRPTLNVLLTQEIGMRLKVVGNEVQPQDIGAVEIACDGGTATTTTVDAVRIKATGRHFNAVTVDTPTAYQPGVEDEGSPDPSEIEIRVDLGRGRDHLAIVGDPISEQFRIGERGINLNADDVAAPDVDLVPRRVEQLRILARDGEDEISGAGGAGTGRPYPRALELNGESGADSVVGGRGADKLAGGLGGDDLRGGAGGDELIGAPGDDDLFGGGGADALSGNADGDLISGGRGTDTARYSTINGPIVTVDIGSGGANDGGSGDGPVNDRDEVLASVENLVGDSEDDTFTGDADANRLVGGLGADSLFGRSGPDLLKAKDGIADTAINCGPGRDRARFDAGLDPAPLSC